MIQVSNTTAQTLAPGQSITFDDVSFASKCNRNEYFSGNNTGVQMMAGVYELGFGANIGATAATTAVQLSIQVNGATLPNTTAISTTAAAGDLNNVSRETIYNAFSFGCNNCGGGFTVTVTNTGTTDVTVGANSYLKIARVG